MPETAAALPSADESERIIIGSVLRDGAETLDRIAATIKPDDMYRRAHRQALEALQAMAGAGEPLEPLALAAALERAGAAPGGRIDGDSVAVWCARLSAMAGPFDVGWHSRRVAGASQRRELLRLAADLQRLAADDGATPDEVAEAVEARARAIADAAAGGFDFPTLADAADRWVTDAEDRAQRGRGHGLKTGIESLDSLTGGFDPGDFSVIGAGTGAGKSVLGMQVAADVARRGGVVLLVSLEMSAEALAGRELCGLADADGFAVRIGRARQSDMDRLRPALAELGQYGRRIAVARLGGGSTVADIRAAAHALRRQRGRLDLVVVDYLQLIRGGNYRSEYERITANSAALKAIALELGIVVVGLSQLNREQVREGKAGEAGRPLRLSDLRGSGQVEQDADQVILLRRPGLERRQRGEDAVSTAELAETVATVAKNRHGDSGTVRLRFDAGAMRFSDQ